MEVFMLFFIMLGKDKEMTKKEFSKILFEALSEEMTKEEIYSHIRYYEEYIENEKKTGLSEDEVISKLGNPRLLAKTILSSSKNKSYTGETKFENDEEKPKLQKKEGLLSKIKRILITILVCVILFYFLRAGIIIFWKIGLPILIVIWLIRLVYKAFK